MMSKLFSQHVKEAYMLTKASVSCGSTSPVFRHTKVTVTFYN